MAATGRKRGKQGKSMSSWFRKIFIAEPTLLDSTSNQEILDRWLAEHPKKRGVPNRIKQAMANVKSMLRQRRRDGLPLDPRAGGEVAVEPRRASRPPKDLDALEVHIDEGLYLARSIDPIKLEKVISLLRQARNQVVWKMGQA
jgi:hypothetical protein